MNGDPATSGAAGNPTNSGGTATNVRFSKGSADQSASIPHGRVVSRLLQERWRSVMYLGIDDMLLRYPDGRDAPPVAAPGAGDFLAWALDTYEVRWLSRRCRTGAMNDDLKVGLSRLLGLEVRLLSSIRGLDWSSSRTKLDGIAWLEHLVLDRPFLWVGDEGDLGPGELALLGGLDLEDCWRLCNATEQPEALKGLHEALQRELAAPRIPLLRSRAACRNG